MILARWKLWFIQIIWQIREEKKKNSGHYVFVLLFQYVTA